MLYIIINIKTGNNNYKCIYKNVHYYISCWHYLYFCNIAFLWFVPSQTGSVVTAAVIHIHVFGQCSINFNQPRLNETLASSYLILILLTYKNHNDNTNFITICKFLFCYSPLSVTCLSCLVMHMGVLLCWAMCSCHLSPRIYSPLPTVTLSLLLWLVKYEVLTFVKKLILYSMCLLVSVLFLIIC